MAFFNEDVLNNICYYIDDNGNEFIMLPFENSVITIDDLKKDGDEDESANSVSNKNAHDDNEFQYNMITCVSERNDSIGDASNVQETLHAKVNCCTSEHASNSNLIEEESMGIFLVNDLTNNCKLSSQSPSTTIPDNGLGNDDEACLDVNNPNSNIDIELDTEDMLFSKSDGIIIYAKPEIEIEPYLDIVSHWIGTECIQFASRISTNKICIFFKSEHDVEKLMRHSSFLEILGEKVRFQRLEPHPTFRLILSNVWPFIPDDVIKRKLSNLGLELISDIKSVHGKFTSNLYDHVKSFERMVDFRFKGNGYVLPSFITVEYRQENYKIGLHDDFNAKLDCN